MPILYSDILLEIIGSWCILVHWLFTMQSDEENIVGKEEKGNFVLSPCFSTLSRSDFLLWATFNSLPNDKILDQSKLKETADDNVILNVTPKLKFL